MIRWEEARGEREMGENKQNRNKRNRAAQQGGSKPSRADRHRQDLWDLLATHITGIIFHAFVWSGELDGWFLTCFDVSYCIISKIPSSDIYTA